MHFEEILQTILTKEVLGYGVLVIVFIIAFRLLRKAGRWVFWSFIAAIVFIGCGLIFPDMISKGVDFINGSWMK